MRVLPIVNKLSAISTPQSLSVLILSEAKPLPPDMIDFGQKENTYQAQLQCAKNKSSIEGLDPGEFPPIPKSSGTSFELSAKLFKDALNKVVFSAATDDSRPILTGVQFAIAPNQITLAAADGFRLSVCNLEIKSDSSLPSFVVPARALGELSRLLNELGDQNLHMKII